MAATQDVVPKRLAVFGSTGQTGRKIVELALDKGNSVNALVRNVARLGELASRINVVEGDAADPTAVDKVVAGSDAVLSALGHSRGSPGDVETVGIGNMVASMRKNGVRRLVVLANTVVRDPADRRTISQALIRGMLRISEGAIFSDSLGKARVVERSELDWTIVRVSILTDAASTGKYHVGRIEGGAGLRVSRGDVADLMLKCAIEGKYIRERPYISA